MTHRQHRAFLAWLDLQWNRPSRTDHYLMAVEAAVVRWAGRTVAEPDQVVPRPIEFRTRSDGGEGPAGKPADEGHHLLPRNHPGRLPEDREPTAEELAAYTAWSKGVWIGSTGGPRAVRNGG